MYDNGIGVAENDATAVEWYRKAAEQGVAPAQHNLGVMYNTGKGIAQNFVKAYMWTSVSADTGHEVAKKLRNLLVEKMTQKQIVKAQDLASKCLESRFKNCS